VKRVDSERPAAFGDCAEFWAVPAVAVIPLYGVALLQGWAAIGRGV
jgi:hypothetical protein